MIRAIDNARSTLVFTNVRSSAEIWYQAILEARPDWAGRIALHHGSLEREVRDWVEDGLRRNAAARRRVHVEPRPRCRLRARRPGAADRQPERRRAPAATRGAQRTPAGSSVEGHRRADAGAGACRSSGSTRSRRRARDRAAHVGARAAGCVDAAPRHLRARRRLPARGGAGRDSRHPRLRAPHRRRVAMGARLRRPRRRELERIPGVSPRRDRRRRRRARARRADRAPPSHADRHHRQRREHHRADAQRPQARPRRGVVHRAAFARRHIRVRGTRARIRARARDDGVGEAGQPQVGDRATLGGIEDAAVVAAVRSHAQADRRREARHLCRPRS